MTGQLDMWANRSAFRVTTPEAIDALFGGDPGEAPTPAVIVFVDCWTSVGGSQFLDSPGTGRYHTYLCAEIVPWVDGHFRTLAAREHRGIAGKSSGGYGAMITPMLRPDLFGGLATHAGDALFEACYQPEFAECARALRDHYDGSYERFWADFRSRPPMSKPDDGALVNEWAMAACYSADPDGTIRLPFDPLTSELIPAVWERWLQLRSRPDGPDARGSRRAAVHARDLDRRRQARRVLPRPRRRGLPSRAAWRPVRRSSASSSSTRSTAASSTATRSRSPGWPTASPAESGRGRRLARCGPAVGSALGGRLRGLSRFVARRFRTR